MSVVGRDAFGNAKKKCDFECGQEGNITLDEDLHACLPCVLKAARHALQRRREVIRAGRAFSNRTPGHNGLGWVSTPTRRT